MSKNCISERLIETMFQYPMLYDTNHRDYKNNREKDHLYQLIGKEFNLTGEELKKRWKNLRDSYVKYLRFHEAPGSVDDGSRYSSWRWAETMDDLYRPFLYKPEKRRFRESEDGDDSNPPLELAQVKMEEGPASFLQEPSAKRAKKEKAESLTASMDEMVRMFQEDARADHDLDATDHLMLAYAKTIKSFTPKRQACTKLKIAQIIMQQELEEIEEGNSSGQRS